MGKLKGVVFVLLLSVYLVSSFQLGNISDNIGAEFNPEEKISGWINLSFNENSNTIISSNYGNSIIIKNFLNNSEYSCMPNDCLIDYSSSNGNEIKSFALSQGESKIISFQASGNINSVNTFSFSINASNSESCINPLKIDFLNNGNTDWISYKVTNNYTCIYETGMGCFSGNSNEVYLGDNPYCEKIKLPESGSYIIGAWVKKDLSSSYSDSRVKMSVFNLNGEGLGTCYLENISSTGKEEYCNVSFMNTRTEDHYVCIQGEEAITKYLIKKENPDITPCGFYGYPGQQTEYHDYYIFARAAKFANIGIINFNQQSYENILIDVEDYLKRFNNNCSSGCNIPLNISSNINLNINLFNLTFLYSGGGGLILEKKFYDSLTIDPKVISNFNTINIDSLNITTPKIPGNYTLLINIANNTILRKNFKVKNVALIKKISPSFASAGVSTKFSVEVENKSTITKYKWTFGDGESEETNNNFVYHIYPEIKNYKLKVEVTDSSGTSAKEIEIISGSPKEIVNKTIKKYKERVTNVSSQISSFDGFYKKKIEALLNITGVQQEIVEIEKDYLIATNDSDYVDIMESLNDIFMPMEIRQSNLITLPFYADVEKISPSKINELSGEDIESEGYETEIARWMEENLELSLSFRYITSYDDNEIKPLMTVFTLNINDLTTEENLNLIIDNNIEVEDKEQKEYYGARYDTLPGKINFFAYEDIPLNEINIYVSPDLSTLEFERAEVNCNYNKICEKGESWTSCRQDCKPWLWTILLWFIIAVGGIIAYILLQYWYTVNYENYLFKNRNDVFNIINFVNNARSQGINMGEIESRLKKSGWNGEQISYVLKKIQGKAVMPFDFVKMFRKKENRYKIN